MTNELDALNSLSTLSRDNFFRLPVLIIGEEFDRNRLADSFLNTLDDENIAWVSKQTPPNFTDLSKLKSNNVIGKEYQFIVYDIETDFDPNLFAALSGTLRGGGLFLILCPPLNDWTKRTPKNHWFMWRFINKLTKSNLCIKITLNNNKFNINTYQFKTHPTQTKNHLTNQQDLAVQDIIHVVRGHRNRPLVLLADRGRGKSAALGIAASQLLTNGLTNIVITAPSLDACAIIFKHIKLSLPSATIKKGFVQTSHGNISFIAPDKLIQETSQASLLIIDEASGIPLSTLEILLKKYSRIVFASTIHGYEGSGHCFPIKFFKYLDKLTPGWKKVILTDPIRWAKADPLELLINQLFLLTPLGKQQEKTPQAELSRVNIQQFSAEKLAKNESLLSQLYTLLSTAHYKTQPSDLLHILNEPDICIFLMLVRDKIIAAAFTIREGVIDNTLGKEIYLGNRRPKGNIIPQTLAMHIGIEHAMQLNYLRIMRIAVQPEHQKLGLGSKLVKHLVTFATKNKYNAIGCTFSTSTRLIDFWGNLAFSILRLGHHRKANSNGYAALMLKPLDKTGSDILTSAQTHFQNNFLYQLKETHKTLDPHIVMSILKNSASSKSRSPIDNFLTIKERQDIESYTLGNRQYEDNLSTIHRLVNHAIAHKKTFKRLTQSQLNILIIKVLQQRSWQDTSAILRSTGKKESAQLLKISIAKIYEDENTLNA